MMRRRSFVRSAAALATLSASGLAPRAQAQSPAPAFPSQQIKFIVPYSPGGLPDTVARVVAKKLTERIGQSVVVDNRPGANGVVAATAVTGAAPDGHTLLLTDDSMMTINPLIYKNLGYDAKKDFLPTALIATAPLFLAVHPSVPANTFQELVALVKSKPGEFAYGSSGIGSTHHLATEAMKAALGLDIRHIPYKGTGQSVIDVMAGQVDSIFAVTNGVLPHVKAGKLRALGVSSLKRSGLAPEVPTIAESGYPGFDVSFAYAMMAPAGTPDEIVQLLSKEVLKALGAPDVQEKNRLADYMATGLDPKRSAAWLAENRERWTKVVQQAGITVE